jgi:hypothetical protein
MCELALCVNQTQLHCVNRMGKTQSKPLAVQNGRGMAWYVWICLKDYWWLNEVPARSLMVIGKMSVNINFVLWCCPRVHDPFHCYALMQKHLTSDWGWPASCFSSGYCTWSVTCLCAILQVSVCILLLILFSQYNILIYIYTLLHIKETEKLWTIRNI